MNARSSENTNSNNQQGGEYQFTVNITPNDYSDGPIIPAEDGLLTAPDGSILTPYSLLELSQKSATTQRRQRKKTNDRNGDYIPRPPNPFILFRCWYTAKVHKPGTHDNADGTLSSLCGQEWANLGTQQRRIFEEAAKIEKLKHAERYPNYRYKPVHKKKQKTVAAAVGVGLEEEEEARPTRSRTKRATTSRAANSSSNSVTPTSMFPGLQPMFTLPPALARHRRSSSVPPLPSELQLCGSEMVVDQSMRPIELPAAPFLALAGQDMPLPRKSRPSLGWDWTRGMSQILTEPPVFDYTALRTSIPTIPPHSAARHRNQLPTFQHNQYSVIQPPPPPFFTSPFGQQEGSIQWTNPNPFGTNNFISNSPGQRGNQLPQLGHGDSTSSSSCSAPSPPPELEISPLDPVPGAEPFDIGMQMRHHHHQPRPAPAPVSNASNNISYPMESHEAQPFDLNIFKKSLDFSILDGNLNLTRPRGMSIFDDPSGSSTHAHTAYASNNTNAFVSSQLSVSETFSRAFNSNSTIHDDHGYSRALNTSNILAGIPAHEGIMEGFA